MNALHDALAALANALSGRQWYVFGAQALRVWGAPRQTLDIDVTVAVGTDELPSLIAALRANGFSTRSPDPVAFAMRYYVIPAAHANGTPVDVVVAGTPFEMEAFPNALQTMGLTQNNMTSLASNTTPHARPRDLERRPA